jgi:hypothetical protein
MKLLIHPNVVDLRAYFYSSGDKVSNYDPAHPSIQPLSMLLTSSPPFLARQSATKSS